MSDISQNIAYRLNKVYKTNAYKLSNTPAETAINVYIAIATPSMDDLKTLKSSIITYMQELSSTQLSQYKAVEAILKTIENEFISERLDVLGWDEIGDTITAILGNTPIAPEISLTVRSCTYTKAHKIYSINTDIYTTSKEVTTTISNMQACSKWVDDNKSSLHLTVTGLVSNCETFSDAGEALTRCQHYTMTTP